jgi:hypothetical protein
VKTIILAAAILTTLVVEVILLIYRPTYQWVLVFLLTILCWASPILSARVGQIGAIAIAATLALVMSLPFLEVAMTLGPEARLPALIYGIFCLLFFTVIPVWTARQIFRLRAADTTKQRNTP